ncbi:MAG: hypothetical protein IJU45_04290, partial [Clostridia bacterium]|nr:hypothetical protein [Clostridia bacterium]
MKSYKEVSDSVFEKSDKIIIENRQKRKKYVKLGLAAVSLCLVAAVSIVFAKGKLDKTNIAIAEGAKYDTVCDSAGTIQKQTGDSPEKETTAVSREEQTSSAQPRQNTDKTVSSSHSSILSQSRTTVKAGKDKKIIS